MKKKILCVLAIALFLMVFVTAVHAEEQEIIDEDEFETRFEEDPEALIAGLEANATVVVPAPADHECRFSLLCKKVKYENGDPVSGAEVTLLGSNYPDMKIRKGSDWVAPPVSKTTNKWGCVCFLILWNDFPPEDIEVTIRVRKGDYEHEKTHTINGNTGHYWFMKIYNWIRPPGVPELALTTPLFTSIGAVAYFWFRRKREKQSI